MVAAVRYKIENSSCLTRYLHQLGWAVFTEPTHDMENLPAHVHRRAYEICYIVHGTVDWWVENAVFEVGPGSIFITFPGERHGGLHDIMNPCELFWAQIELPRRGCLPGLSQQETASLAGKLAGMNARQFPGTAETPILFRRIVDEHRHPSDYSTFLVRTGLIELIIAVIQGYEVHPQEHTIAPRFAKPICTALNLIDQHLSEKIQMNKISRDLGLNETSFYRRFHDEVGMTPGEYLTQQRVSRAKVLLRNPTVNITTVAHAVGYSSSQYFCTIFKRITGLTPSEYRTSSIQYHLEGGTT